MNSPSGSGARASDEAPVHRLLARLDGVRELGPGRWIARCPAHDDRTPSLSIRELDDGRLLIKCFAECGAADVMHAAGLELHDLFPERLVDHHYRPLRPQERWVPADVLRAVGHEVLVVAIAAEDVSAGKALSEHDRERVTEAAARLRTAAEEVTCG